MTARCIVLAAVTLASSAAFAEPKPDICNQFPQLRGNILGFVVDGDEATFELLVHPLITTVVEFSSEVTDYAAPAGLDARHAAYPWSMSLTPSATSRGTMDFETRAHKVHFTIRLVGDPAEATSRAIVWQRAKEDAGKPAVQVLGRIVCNGDETPPQRTRSVIPGAENAVTARVLDESVCDLLNDQGNVVRLHDRLPDDQAIGILAKQYVRLGAKGYLRLELINREVVPFKIGTVQLFDQNRTPIVPSAIRIRASRDASSELMGTIPARNSVVGTIAVPDADLLTESFSLMVSEPDGGRTIWRDGIRLDDLIPSPTTGDTIKLYTRPDGVDVWEFNPPDDNEGRITLDVQALYGAIWLSDGTGLDKLGPASLSGLGVRVGYGINRLLTFEGAVVGARSGVACFMTPGGELERSAMLGRIYMGGLLRFGERFMPTARLGVGLQGASQRSKMVDGSMDDSAFELGILLGAGIGLDVRLGKSLLLGAGISVEQNLATATTSFESGIHIGYAWKP